MGGGSCPGKARFRQVGRRQHFQAAERYWSELLETSERWDHAYNYGLYAVEFSRESIANAQFELSRCLARLPDGTMVTLQPGQEPPEPAWKGFDAFKDYVHPRQPTWKG